MGRRETETERDRDRDTETERDTDRGRQIDRNGGRDTRDQKREKTDFGHGAGVRRLVLIVTQLRNLVEKAGQSGQCECQ